MQMLHLLWHLKNKKQEKKQKKKQEMHGEHLISPHSQYFLSCYHGNSPNSGSIVNWASLKFNEVEFNMSTVWGLSLSITVTGVTAC